MKIEIAIQAAAFIAQHYNEHLEQDLNLLVGRCAYHLMVKFSISRSTATTYAGQAMGEFSSGKAKSPWRVDMNCSTPETIFMVNRETGERLLMLPSMASLCGPAMRV